MQIALPTPLLGGLSPVQFMRKHWQKKPLLVRQAFADVQPPASLKELAALAARDDVESRLVERQQLAILLRLSPLDALDHPEDRLAEGERGAEGDRRQDQEAYRRGHEGGREVALARDHGEQEDRWCADREPL